MLSISREELTTSCKTTGSLTCSSFADFSCLMISVSIEVNLELIIFLLDTSKPVNLEGKNGYLNIFLLFIVTFVDASTDTPGIVDISKC